MAFINGIGLISPQNTLDPDVFLPAVVEHHADYMKCVEPVFKEYIDPLLARRMSRLIKTGIVSAKLCLRDAGCSLPDAIITGTGLGSIEDTEKILGEITKEEKFLNPTPFIQSTYNTISSQIAITLKCHGYNSTYVHRSFSFESGLQDAMLQFEEGIAGNILAGGIDEMTGNHLQITRRIGLWKMHPVHNLSVLKENTPGALAGEGSGFFLLSSARNDHTYATLKGVETIYKPSGTSELGSKVRTFLSGHGLTPGDMDVIITGINGDTRWDPLYNEVNALLFPSKPLAWYKHLSGEYHTASTFALWMASNMIKRQVYPHITMLNDFVPPVIRHVLIHNHFRGDNHSFILAGS
ncbi:MAG: beta-ketoacyl synthase N-terminal-like domain-containing protein [bacterium]